MDLRRRLRDPAATRGIIAVAIVLLAHGLAAGSLAVLQHADADVVLAGTVVAGVPVGGLERAQLRTQVEARAEELLDDPVRVTAAPAAGRLADDLTVVTDRRSVGMTADAEAAADEAWSLGRRGLWRALIDQLRARTAASLDVRLPRDLDPTQVERWSEATATALSDEPRPAEVELVAVSPPDDTRVEVTPASPGARVSAEGLRADVDAGYATVGELEIRASREPVPPPTTEADLDAAVSAAESARSGEVTLRNPTAGADVVLASTDLAAILRFEVDPQAPEGERLALVADPEMLQERVGEQEEAVDIDAEDARIELQDGAVELVGGSEGFTMDLQLAADRVRGTSQRSADREAPLPGTVLDPEITRASLQRAVTASGLDVSAPIVLENVGDGEDLEVSPEQLTRLLEVGFDPGADDNAEDAAADDAPTDDAAAAVPGEGLTITASGERLLEILDGDTLDGIETEPTEARFEVSEGEVSIVDGAPGRTLQADEAARRLAELATVPEPRQGWLPLLLQQPELTEADAQRLGIEEEVSSFTTSMVAGQSRNNNIRQAADYLDGSVVLPGERLSLNDAIGRRTTARGFGAGGFIRDGEIVEVVGGGVSQMATTFMNAAWFAGVELIEFRPHSLYFSQYPVGRESTMSGNTLDVVFENDSPYGILVTTDHSDTHLTVSFWSTDWAEVDTWTGEPFNRVPGELRDGFDVRFGRTITYPDGTSDDETYFHRYRPEDAPEGAAESD
jgi:vancomycin resistance protein YoaR